MSGHVVNDETASLLPNVSTAFEVSHSVIDQRLLAIDTDIIRRERQPGTCTAAFVPFLGWERSVHHWTADESINRARAASSFDDHASYGAPATLENEIQLDVGYAAITIREWFEVTGFEWPDFQVVVRVDADGPPLPTTDALLRSAIRRKNVRDWPAILFEARLGGPANIAAAATVNGIINSLPLDPTPHNEGGIYWAALGTLIADIKSRPL